MIGKSNILTLFKRLHIYDIIIFCAVGMAYKTFFLIITGCWAK